MDLPALRCFVAVAEERHFRRAARRLHISQPPLSARIRTLELELGVRLFHRGHGAPVMLTPAGTALLPIAQEIVELAQLAHGAVGRIRRGEAGALSVAIAAGVPGPLLGHAVRRFRAAWPEVDVTLCEMDASRQVTELSDGRIDVAVIQHVRGFDDASAMALSEAELGIAFLSEDPLAAQEGVDPHRLADGRAILVPGTLAPDCEVAVVEHCRSLGFEPTGRYGAAGPYALLEALAAVVGRPAVALAPGLACPGGKWSAAQIWRPLEGPPLHLMTSALVDPLHDWAAARNFVETLADSALVPAAD